MVRLFALVALALAPSACSLGNLAVDRCESSAACAVAFGAGSECRDGYCSEAASCATTPECRSRFGYGSVCSEGRCAVVPAEPRCTLSEPPELVDALPGTVGDRVLVGALLRDAPSQNARADAMRLAVGEINGTGGLDGFDLGLLVCRNDAGEGTTEADETARLTEYLAGSLGVPLILGPASSSNVAAALARLKVKSLPAAMISPSATAAGLSDDPVVFGDRGPTLFWRTCPRDTLQAQVLVDEVGKAAVSRVAVVYQSDPYGSGIESAFRDGLAAAMPSVTVDSFPFRTDANLDADLAQAAADAKAKGAAAVVLAASDATTTVKLLELLAKTGAKPGAPKLFLTDGSRSKVILDAKLSQSVRDLVKAAIGTGPAAFDPTASAAYAKFGQQMKSLYDVTVTGFGFVSHSYDATYVGAYGLLHALAKGKRTLGGFDGFDVTEGMSRVSQGNPVAIGQTDFGKAVAALTTGKTVDVRGISGTLDFDPERGEAPGPIEVWKANDAFDDFTTVTVVQP